jgi:DNA-3-methyladenine glycosylase II
MSGTFSAQNFKQTCDNLAAQDKDLSLIIAAHGYPPMWTRPNTFETIVHIILEQQVSLASALAALKKLQEKTKELSPAKILALSDEELRACYVSRQKMIYIRGLARAIKDKQLNLDALATRTDEEVRAALTALKGIGNWTVDVYLMFVLQRTDIFPIGDLAAVNALKRAKSLAKDTPKESLLVITAQWAPFRTIATMILWHHYLSSPIRQQQ